MRSIGNLALAIEVPAPVVILKTNGTVEHLGTLEEIESLDVERLLEVDAVLAVQAGRLHLGLTLDGETECLIVGEPDVVLDEGVHVGDCDLLRDVDLLVLVCGRGREVDGGERGLGLDVGQVHLAGEAVNVGVDRAVCGDGRVDLHGVGVCPGVEDVDTLDLQLGVVHLVLCDVGHTDEDAGNMMC